MYRRANERTQCATKRESFQLKINNKDKSRSTTVSHLLPIFSLSLLMMFICFDIGNAANVYRRGTNNTSNNNVPANCKHSNETHAARELQKTCEDCYNLIRNETLKELCRSNCYSGIYFTSCLVTLCIWSERNAYKRMIENLSGNKFAVWHYDEVRLEGANRPEHFSSKLSKGYCTID